MKLVRALLIAALVQLGGCGREDDASGTAREQDAPAATAPIVDKPALPGEEVQNARAPAPAAMPRGAAEAAARAAPPSSETRYRAVGTEPFWAVTIRGSVLTLERPERPPVHVPVTRTDDGRAMRYLGEGLAMVVTEGPCSDGMSDAVWAERVSLSFDDATLKGCGGVREDF